MKPKEILRRDLENLINTNINAKKTIDYRHWLGYLLLEIDDKLEQVVELLNKINQRGY